MSASAPECHIVDGCITLNPAPRNRVIIIRMCEKTLNEGESHQIFPGSRPWYIMAMMRQVGFRTVTVFSYLGAQMMLTDENSNINTFTFILRLHLESVSVSDSLFLLLLYVLILGISSLIAKRRAVIYQLLDDFLRCKNICINSPLISTIDPL